MNNYIPKEVFGAVMFAKKLLKDGKRREVAIEVAAKACKKDEKKIEPYIDVPLKPKKYCWSIIYSEDKVMGKEIFEVKITPCYNHVNHAKKIKEEKEELQNKNKYKKYSFEVSPEIYNDLFEVNKSLSERLNLINQQTKEMDE